MENPRTVMGGDIAQFIELHEVELVELMRLQFRQEYPDSDSSAMPDSELDAWSKMELAEFCRVLRGGAPEIRPHDVYEGDAGQNVDEIIQPITTFIEGRLFIARTLASFIWRRFDRPLQVKKDAFGVLDSVTLKMIRDNLRSFTENEMPDGCVMRTWDFSSRASRVRGPSWPVRQSSAEVDAGPKLTRREEEIARLVAIGRTNGEIAAQLGLAQSTVKNRLVRIFDKLGVNTRAELASRMARDSFDM